MDCKAEKIIGNQKNRGGIDFIRRNCPGDSRMEGKLFILFTMDVEPPASSAGVSGPDSFESGIYAVQSYSGLINTWGYPATYFVHPEVACADAPFFKSLARGGNSLGLHLHTTKFDLYRQEHELGGLTAKMQHTILNHAVEMFTKGTGFRPELFRPGCFSANDSTYGVLDKLGFKGGGVSIPGRVWPERYCIWSCAYPYTHFAHEAFRQNRGDLQFVDIPLSVDMSSPLSWNPVGFFHYPDLRPGGVYAEKDEVKLNRTVLLRNILKKMSADNPPIKTLVVDVHNDRDFVSENSSVRKQLIALISDIEAECNELGWKPIPSTYDEVVDLFRLTSLKK